MRTGGRAAGAALLHEYAEATVRPVYALAFIGPLIVLYELGTLLFQGPSEPRRVLVAQSLVEHLVAWIGATGPIVPGLVALLSLLIWHAIRRDSWRMDWRVLPVMLVESALLTVPLLVLNRLALRVDGHLAPDIALAIGASVYEELVFRLYLIGALVLMLKSICNAPAMIATSIALPVSAALFAVAHYQPIGGETFSWPGWLARCTAGLYLGGVFLLRGLGISTGCHAMYNVLLLI